VSRPDLTIRLLDKLLDKLSVQQLHNVNTTGQRSLKVIESGTIR